jgi:hypothetical protein
LPPQSTATRDPSAANNTAFKAKEVFIEAHLICEASFSVHVQNKPDAYPLLGVHPSDREATRVRPRAGSEVPIGCNVGPSYFFFDNCTKP